MLELPRPSPLSALVLALALLAGCAKGVSTDGSSALPGDQTGPCGNGEIDTDEECDGDFLGSETCESLGHGPGMLACDPVTCSFDTSMCENMPNGGGGTGSTSSGGTGG